MDDNTSRATHNERLDRLAHVAVHVGLGLQVGQEIVLTAPLDALPLTRRITEHAYKAGASLVTPLFTDEEAALARFVHAADSAFDTAPGWLFEAMASAYRTGAARLAISGENPTLLAEQDSDKVARVNHARSIAYRPALELISNFATNWTIISYATPAWAKLVFPDEPIANAIARLWDAIFAASRVDQEDPLAAWAAHNDNLRRKTHLLNSRRYSALHFRGPGTDLRVGLADGHIWLGGAEVTQTGIICNPNIPTEEVFTMPHRSKVDGHVQSTRPLSYQGTLIRDIRVRFDSGRIVEVNASSGLDVLGKLLDTDEGARRLGEVALVPHSSPISKTNLLFYNTLFDENAASHLAIGQAYRNCLKDGTTLGDVELASRGANSSLIHIDWMIGSAETDVDGIPSEGGSEALMRRGEWNS
jgi:aminopeptidase